MPDSSAAIPLRPFGKHADAKISALGLGGHHIGQAADRKTAIDIVHGAIDGGVTFFDNCWEYHRGKTEAWMGAALKGKRDKVFLMTKVCTHGRDGSLAMEMLEQSLTRLETDHLDLWQIHGVVFENDPELFIRPGGAAEALLKARDQGKVRFLGFTGHKRPEIHLAMLNVGFPWDAVQMPLNPFDAHFLSFEQQVLPELNRRGVAALGMKPIGGNGDMVKKGAVTAEQALRYAMSLPVTTTITGMETMDVLRQNLKIAQGFTPLPDAEMQAIRDQVKQPAGDGRFEPYKTSLKFDNPEARMAHNFPLDDQSVEVKEMLKATENNGHPWPQVSQ
jgi:aryl-alcohol dehydrogenase-like predicted oxidoreductase